MIGEIDRSKFFDLYRQRVGAGTLGGPEVEHINLILDRACFDERLNCRLLGWAIATARWETRRFERLREVGSDAYLRQYQGKGGNNQPGDYKRFRGGGYPHLTFRENYRKATRLLRERGIDIDLETNPEDIVINADANYEILIGGSLEGWFTGRRVTEFIHDSVTNYRSARLVINPGELHIADGRYRATPERKAQCKAAVDTIVVWSKAIEGILRATASEAAISTVGMADLDVEGYEPKPEPATRMQELMADVDTKVDDNPPATRVEVIDKGDSVQVEKLPPEKEPPVPPDPTDFIQASTGGAKRLNAFRLGQGLSAATAVGGFSGLIGWAKDNPFLAVIFGVLILAAIVGAVYLVRQYIATQKELDVVRMTAAADKTKSNVR